MSPGFRHQEGLEGEGRLHTSSFPPSRSGGGRGSPRWQQQASVSPCAPFLLSPVLQGRCELLQPCCGARQGCCAHRRRAQHAGVPTVGSQPGSCMHNVQLCSSCVLWSFCTHNLGLLHLQCVYGSASLRLCGACSVWCQHEYVPGRLVRNGFLQHLLSASLTLGSLTASLVSPGLAGSITRVSGAGSGTH